MLTITVPSRSFWDEKKEEFFDLKGGTITLEHSLVSISKWEAKWHKSFLSKKDQKTQDEILDYIVCMTLTQHVNPLLYLCLTDENYKQIYEYIENPMTATKFLPMEKSVNREKVTSELIYYWMIALGIPFECQKWHLNRLLTLIEVCNRKNQKPKKMGTKNLMARNNALNAARRKQLGTRG